MIEGNILTPRLVGRSVGLHAVWVLLALMVGGSLFGFVGVLLAVPIAALIGVLVRFSINLYKQSDYYQEKQAVETRQTKKRKRVTSRSAQLATDKNKKKK
jgi:predicted PurR-regulated permease PerM